MSPGHRPAPRERSQYPSTPVRTPRTHVAPVPGARTRASHAAPRDHSPGPRASPPSVNHKAPEQHPDETARTGQNLMPPIMPAMFFVRLLIVGATVEEAR